MTPSDRSSVRPVPAPPGRWRWLRDAALYTVVFLGVPNLLVVVLGQAVYLVRPPVNLDYALLAPAFAVAGGAVTAGLFGLLLAVDLMRSVLPAFHLSPQAAVESALAVSGLPPLVTLGAGMAALVGIGLLAGAARRGLRPVPRRPGAAGLVLAAAAALAVAEDRLQAPGPDGEAALRTDVVTSAVSFLYQGVRAGRADAGPVRHGVEAATDPVFAAMEAGRALPGRVVVVLVESLGLPVDPAVEALQRAALDDPRVRARYRLAEDTIRFRGSTVPAELRELCGLGVATVHPDTVALPLARCLPARLGERGYRTVGVHGFSGVFFRRSAWYPALFDEVYLGAAVHRLTGAPDRCGLVFVGACDGDIGRWLAGRLTDPGHGRQLVYWLTLNAHAPFPAPDPALTVVSCADLPGLEPEVCRLLGHHDLVLRSVAAAAVDPALEPTLFVIVGDHAPPFATHGSRRRFHPDVVPAYLLWPRGGADDG